jgi:alkylated DNA nucleotide flippase Atl1
MEPALDTLLQAQFRLGRDLERSWANYADTLASVIDIPEERPEVKVRGERQAAILALSDLFTTRGMTVNEISREIEYDEPNTYTAVNVLQKQGLLELAFDGTPKRYRLAIKYRRDKILRAARMVPPGRWAPYSAVGIAASGHKNAARVVARSAAHNPAFPTPWRVINADGSIPEGWRGYGGGPEKCRELLEQEGLEFIDGRADPTRKLTWEELDQLLKADEAIDTEA